MPTLICAHVASKREIFFRVFHNCYTEFLRQKTSQYLAQFSSFGAQFLHAHNNNKFLVEDSTFLPCRGRCPFLHKFKQENKVYF